MSIVLRLILNLLRLVAFPVWALVRKARRGRASWVRLRIDGAVTDLPGRRPRWIARALSGFTPAPLALRDLRAMFDVLLKDPRATGLFLEIERVDGGWATLAALRSELLRLPEAGKRLIVWLPSGANQRELYVASAAERVWMGPSGSLTLLGPVAARTYVAPLLERIGVRLEVLAEGEYKTAAESFARVDMSEREREQLTAILVAVEGALIEALGARPQASKEGIAHALSRGILSPAQALASGIVDGLLYEDEALRTLAEMGNREGGKPGNTKMVKTISTSRYWSARPRPLWLPLKPQKRVVILRLVGAIGTRAGADAISLHPSMAALRSLARDDGVAGVILFIDSPGGSAIASDLLYREVVALSRKKPIVAWLGNVAASGGYYLAVGASTIVCEKTTVTGSIGVISARPVVSALFEKLGIRREVVKLAPHADLNSPHRALEADERALLEADIARFYARFLEVVAEGRKRTVDAIKPLAGGRVYAGVDAYAVGLVDVLGGYREARVALDGLLRERAIDAHPDPLVVTPPLRDVPPPPPVEEALEKAASVLPPLAELRAMGLFALQGEQVLAYAPNVVRID